LPGSSKLTSSGREDVICTTFSCNAPKRVASPKRLRVLRFEGWLQASAALLALKVNLGLNSMPPIDRVLALPEVTPPEWQASIMVMTLSAPAVTFCVA
jgi:hypothetical protein